MLSKLQAVYFWRVVYGNMLRTNSVTRQVTYLQPTYECRTLRHWQWNCGSSSTGTNDLHVALNGGSARIEFGSICDGIFSRSTRHTLTLQFKLNTRAVTAEFWYCLKDWSTYATGHQWPLYYLLCVRRQPLNGAECGWSYNGYITDLMLLTVSEAYVDGSLLSQLRRRTFTCTWSCPSHFCIHNLSVNSGISIFKLTTSYSCIVNTLLHFASIGFEYYTILLLLYFIYFYVTFNVVFNLFRLCRCYSSVVYLSVCHACALCTNGTRHRHDFFCIRQPHVSPRSH